MLVMLKVSMRAKLLTSDKKLKISIFNDYAEYSPSRISDVLLLCYVVMLKEWRFFSLQRFENLQNFSEALENFYTKVRFSWKKLSNVIVKTISFLYKNRQIFLNRKIFLKIAGIVDNFYRKILRFFKENLPIFYKKINLMIFIRKSDGFCRKIW